jgi:hypothetical protein
MRLYPSCFISCWFMVSYTVLRKLLSSYEQLNPRYCFKLRSSTDKTKLKLESHKDMRKPVPDTQLPSHTIPHQSHKSFSWANSHHLNLSPSWSTQCSPTMRFCNQYFVWRSLCFVCYVFSPSWPWCHRPPTVPTVKLLVVNFSLAP